MFRPQLAAKGIKLRRFSWPLPFMPLSLYVQRGVRGASESSWLKNETRERRVQKLAPVGIEKCLGYVGTGQEKAETCKVPH